MQVMCMSIQLYNEPKNVIMLMIKLLRNITGNDKTYSPRLAVRLYTKQNDLEGCSLGNCKVEKLSSDVITKTELLSQAEK